MDTLISLSAHWGERVPDAQRRAGEVGTLGLYRLWNPPPYLTSPPRLLIPRGAERDGHESESRGPV
jgi:hypothetical protein